METRIVEILRQLVGINSVNLTLSGGPGEKQIAGFIQQYLRSLGLDAQIQRIAADRSNVIAAVPGKDRNRSLILNGHLDTVGVEGMEDPFTLKCEGDRLCGRGAYDMKGSLAVMLLLADYFARHRPPIKVLLTFVADEEDKSIGMESLVADWLSNLSPQPIGAIFLEPTEEDIGVCHRGFTWFELEVTGKAAHGSRPEEGINAIMPLISALTELSKIQDGLRRRDADPLLGHASIHASTITGGSELSVIPGYSHLQWERRTLPGESRNDLRGELEQILEAVRGYPGNHGVEGRESFVRQPYRIPDNAEIFKRLQKAAPRAKPVGLPFWADSGIAGHAGIPSLLFGPAGHGAHAVDEWVSLKSLARIYMVVKEFIESC